LAFHPHQRLAEPFSSSRQKGFLKMDATQQRRAWTFAVVVAGHLTLSIFFGAVVVDYNCMGVIHDGSDTWINFRFGSFYFLQPLCWLAFLKFGCWQAVSYYGGWLMWSAPVWSFGFTWLCFRALRMDALLKRRVRNAAAVYFSLTALCVFAAAWFGRTLVKNYTTLAELVCEEAQSQGEIYMENWGDSAVARYLSLMPWYDTGRKLVFTLQPQLWFLEPQLLSQSETNLLLGKLFFPTVSFISAFVWSWCVGWFFICTKDWLNHFPVLGRKVF
jgi:hypothetical protein